MNLRAPSGRVWAVGATLCFVLVSSAAAQTYPVKPLRFVVPFAAGGGTDILARLLGQRLAEALGQPVVVDNRGGAGGVIGAEIVAKSPPDGYTLMLGSPGPLTINPHLVPRLPYDPQRDIAPVMLATVSAFVLVVHPSLPAKSVKEFLALAKAKPGQLNYGSSGNGSVAHFSAEQLKGLTGINIVHIPYKGSAPALNDLIAGQLDLMMENMPTIIAHARSGKVRALAVGTKTRSTLLPELPPLTEAGVPGYESSTAFGVLVPARTPPEIVGRLNGELVKVLRLPDIRERLAGLGMEPVGGTPEAYAAHIREESAKDARIVKAAGIKID